MECSQNHKTLDDRLDEWTTAYLLCDWECIYTVLLSPFCLFVRISVCLSNMHTVTKRNNLLPKFLFRIKDLKEWFLGHDPLHLKFWVKMTQFLRTR